MVAVSQLRPGVPFGRMVLLPEMVRPTLGTPLSRSEIDQTESAGVAHVPILQGIESRDYDSAAGRTRAGLLHRVLDASLPTSRPEARSSDPEHGVRARRALERALLAAASFAPLADLIVERWLNPRMVAAGAESALLSAAVGANLGWDEERLAELALAALLADVGMSFLRAGLVLKPGPLSADERRRMQRHPDLGAQALAILEEVVPIVPRVAQEHHECHDGSGYPNRLRGNRIATEAQIVWR